MYKCRSLGRLFGVAALAASCESPSDVGETAQSVTCISDDSCALDQICDTTRKTCLRPPATRNELNTPGTKTGCHERADSYLEPVQKYVDFLSTLRPSNRLFVSGIWTLPPLDGGGELTVVARSGPSGSHSLNRLPQACAAESGGIAGAPQLRLSNHAAWA